MRFLSSLAAAALAVGTSAAAMAATVSLDEFDTAFDPNPLTTTSGTVTSSTTITPGGNTFQRTTTLTVDGNSNGAPSGSSIRTDTGTAIFSNDTGVTAMVTFAYDTDSVFSDLASAGMGTLTINELFADRPRTYTLMLNGVTQSMAEFTIDTDETASRLIMLDFDTADFDGDDLFELTIDSGVEGVSSGSALDLEIAFLDVFVPDQAVPAPAALGLMGLGLAGLGFARRRKSA